MATLASITELRFMHLRMTCDTVRAHAWRRDVAFIVTGLALRLGVARREAQARMIGPDVGDLSPVALVVAGGALGTGELSFVRIFVARDAVGLQSEERWGATSIAAVVAVLAYDRTVGALERPTRFAMVEPLFLPSGPAHELGVPSEVLDMTSAAGLLAILPSCVQAQTAPDSDAEVVVTGQTGAGIEPFAARVAFAAIRVAIDLGMGTGQLSGRKKLGAGSSWHQRSAHGRCDHHAGQERQRCASPGHEEKIQR